MAAIWRPCAHFATRRMVTFNDILESRFVQALVAGLVVAAGWLVNGVSNRREAARLRAEKLRDYHRAIYAEIVCNLDNLQSREALETYRDEMMARMRADPSYVPLIPREQNDMIFQALVGEINILPRATIDPIVVYYSQLHSLEALIEDMRSASFAALDQDRRIVMYRDYVDLKAQAFEDGHYALRMIAAFAEGGREAALEEEARIARELSSPGGVLSDPSQEQG